MQFASDNTSGAHPRVIAALARANDGHAPSYAGDALTRAAGDRVRDLFDAPEAEVHLMPSGTGANALALAALSPPWGKVFCSRTAHVLTSEAGAIPFYGGGTELVPCETVAGKVTGGGLATALQAMSRADVHAGERAAVTLTNATELGTVYAPGELRELARFAAGAALALHIDGARLANAIAALGCAPADLTHRAGVHALSFGMTKNGGMMIEAVVLFDPGRAHGLEMRRMRGGQLMSKHRFLAAQMLALLEDGLWLENAAHANAMAARLAAGLAGVAGVTIDVPPATNQLFVTLPGEAHARARAAGARYFLWPMVQDEGGDVSVRLVCGWSTTAEEVDRLVEVLTG